MIHTLDDKLRTAFCPSYLRILDDSAKHAIHAQSTGGHYQVVLVSAAFQGQSRLERHRAVYKVLEKSFTPSGIHALGLRLFTPEEWHNSPIQRKLALKEE